MPERAPPPEDISSLSIADIARLVEGKRLPPVAQWNPARCGHSGMRIARDGRWFHDGAPIDRPAMVRLFSTVLRREGDGTHVLVTPAEKLAIDVEDAAFVAIEVKSEGTGQAREMAFRLNTGELVSAGADHGFRMQPGRDGPLPYLHVRGGLEARIARPVYYELAQMAIEEANDPLGLWSRGAFLRLAA